MEEFDFRSTRHDAADELDGMTVDREFILRAVEIARAKEAARYFADTRIRLAKVFANATEEEVITAMAMLAADIFVTPYCKVKFGAAADMINRSGLFGK